MSSFEATQERLFEAMDIDPHSRFIDRPRVPVRTHVLEAGDLSSDEVPIVLVHGTGAFGSLFAPLVEHLTDRWTIAIDRPGYGLSGDFVYTAQTLRETAVAVLEGLLDELGIDQVDLVGSSAGGYWSLVFASARPDRVRRVTLLGGVPTFPGTRPPMPLRLLTVPVLNQLVARLQPASEDGVVEQFHRFGEGETIQAYPALIRLLVAQAENPRSNTVEISGFASFLRVRGWHPTSRLREDEVADLRAPTLAVWGDDDLLASPDAVRDTVESMPDGRLETVAAGHLPWLGHPETCAELILE